MKFERYMALRYLRGAQGREEGRGFLRFITFVAVGGVALGVAALLLSLSVVRGFSQEIQEKIIGFGAHVQVENYQDAPLDRAGDFTARLAAMDGVQEVAPVVQEFILLRRSPQAIDGVVLIGVKRLPPYLAENLVAGTPLLRPDTAAAPGIVIGRQLARLLNVSVGDRVTAYSMRRLVSDGGPPSLSALARPRVKQFVVQGVYETALYNFDEINVYTALEEARDLLDYGPDQVTRLDLTLADVERAQPVAFQIEEALGFPVMARTIYEVWRGLFAWVNLQESIIPLVISVIVLVAAFNIIGTLLMIILEKSREVGVLASMGASPRALRRLFLWLGLLVGVFGTLVGQVLALVLALVQQRYALIPLPEEAYYMETAPIALHALDFVIVGIVTLLLCALASYVPARVASRIDPIRVIRFR